MKLSEKIQQKIHEEMNLQDDLKDREKSVDVLNLVQQSRGKQEALSETLIDIVRLEQQLEKLQNEPITVYDIYSDKGYEGSFRTPEKAKAKIEELKRNFPNIEFWYEKEEIK